MPLSVILLLLALAGSAVSGFVGFNLGVDHNKATEADKREIVAEAVDAANIVAAAAIAKMTPKHTTIRQTLEKEIHENTKYIDCQSSDSIVRTFNSGFATELPNAAGGIKLPTPNPTK
jgi:hypothetical protein